jgi:hypothetical protein
MVAGAGLSQLASPIPRRAETASTRITQSGASIMSISPATSRSFKESAGNRQTETEWHRITRSIAAGT